MCLVKKPKIKTPAEGKEKDPAIIRNPILDGMLGNIAALRGSGRNGMRIDLLNPLAIPVGGGTGVGSGGGGGTTSVPTAGTSSGTSGSSSTSSSSTGTSSGSGGGRLFSRETTL